MVGAIFFIVAGALLALAARPLTDIESSTATEPPRSTYTVGSGTVGRTIELSALPRWEAAATVVNRRAGTVTSLDALGQVAPVEEGDVLYSVDLRPTIAAVGAVPAFRELRSGMRGADVVQLQQLLDRAGFDVEADGDFGSSTRTAVEAWQRQVGVEPTSVVALGDVVFVPQLPTRLVVDPAVRVGSRLDDGATAATGFVAEPRFVVPIQPEQTVLFAADMRVQIGDPPVEATVEVVTEDEEGTLLLSLELSAGCAELCAVLMPGDESVQVPAVIAVVPETQGIIVPVAAVGTAADGQATVDVVGAGRVEIETGPSADGLVIVTEGLTGGERIVIDG